jgi:hypothetical protein
MDGNIGLRGVVHYMSRVKVAIQPSTRNRRSRLLRLLDVGCSGFDGRLPATPPGKKQARLSSGLTLNVR